MKETTSTGQPRVLVTLFFTEMWERFNYYGMRALLVLYMIYDLFSGNKSFGDTQAYGIYAAFAALVYATPYIGGILADRYLGYKKSIIFGSIIMASGEFLMMVHQPNLFFVALSLMIVGNGFFKPNMSSLVGSLYKPGDPRRDGGFTIFYMGINLGATISPILLALTMEMYGFNVAFGLAGVGMLAGLATFLAGKGRLADFGNPPSAELLKKKYLGLPTEWLIYLLALLFVPAIMLLLFNHTIMDWLFPVFGIFVVISLFYQLIRSPKVERERLMVVMILILFSVMFWSFYEQSGSSLTLFTQLNLDRTVGEFQIPTPLFQSLSGLFIIVMAPFFAYLWVWLNRRGWEPSTPAKFALGLILLGLGYGSLVAGSTLAQAGLVPLVFIFTLYLFHTMGELSLSPVGLSMVTKLSPPRMVGMIMGTWLLSIAFAQYFGGMIARYTSTDAYMVQSMKYSPRLDAQGTDMIEVVAYDSKGVAGDPFQVHIHVSGENKELGASFRPAGLIQYKSVKPGAAFDYTMLLPFPDVSSEQYQTEWIETPKYGMLEKHENSFTYTAPADTQLVVNLKWRLFNSIQADTLQLMVVIDTLQNHAPTSDLPGMEVFAIPKPWYSNSDISLNLCDYMYDPDGDDLEFKIITKPDINIGTVRLQKNLHTQVGAEKTIQIYIRVFRILFITATLTGLFLLLLVPVLRKWMHGEH